MTWHHIGAKPLSKPMMSQFYKAYSFNELTDLPPGQNGRHFADDIFRCIFMNEKFCILIKMSLKFVPKGPVDINPVLI